MSKQTDKTCIKCDVLLTEENWKRYNRLGYVNKCNSCLNAEKLAWSNAWNKSHRAEATVRSNRHKAKMRLTDPVKWRARSAYGDCRKRAIKQGMPYDLTPKFVLQLMREAIVCPYFGWTLTHAAGKARTLASLDRIDSAKGYTQDNVKVISYLANLMKSFATEEELLAFANGVQRLHAASTEAKCPSPTGTN